MATYEKREAVSRAKTAMKDASTLCHLIATTWQHGIRINDETAEEMRGMLEFIIDQSHDTIEES